MVILDKLSSEELVNELIQFYYFHDEFQSELLSPHEVKRYIEYLLQSGRVITVEDEGELAGYVETWRINFEQFGRILCGISFHIGQENITDGNILYLANITIKSNYRRGRVIKMLRDRVFEQNKDAEYFTGQAKRKMTGLVKVFRVSDICLKKGKDNG